MKCQRCGNEFDTSSVPTNCPKCGYKLPYTEITLRAKKGDKSKETQGRLQIDGEYLRFAKKQLAKKAVGIMLFGYIGSSIIDSFDNNAVLSFNRSDFTDIKRLEGAQGNLMFYELTTQSGIIQILPSVNSREFENAMTDYINLPCAAKEEPIKNSPTKQNSDNEMKLPVDELKLLKELHDEGVITDDEFTKKKKQILGL